MGTKMNLKKCLIIGIAISLMISVGCFKFWQIPNYSKSPPRASNGSIEITSVYEVNGSTVSILSGDIFSIAGNKPNSAIVIGAKPILEDPYVPGSLDYVLRSKFRFNSPEEKAFKSKLSLHKAAATNSTPPFIARFEPKETPISQVLFMLAGIDADMWNGDSPKGAEEKIINTIEEGVEKIVNQAAQKDIDQLYFPLLGAGAGKLRADKSIKAILSGINSAAYTGSSPKEIYLVLYSSPKKGEAKRSGELSELAYWAFESLKDNGAHGIWKHKSHLLLMAQLFLIMGGVLLSALVSVYWLRSVMLTPGAILGNIIKWVLISTGAIAISKNSAIALEPLDLDKYLIILALSFIIPIWEWGKMGDPIEVKDASD